MLTKEEIFSSDNYNCNGLMRAVIAKDLRLVKEIIELLSKAELFTLLQQKNILGNTSLHLSCEEIAMSRFILLAVDSIEKRVKLLGDQGHGGFTPLVGAAYRNNVEALKCLLSFVPRDQRMALLEIEDEKKLTAKDALEHFGKLAEIQEFCDNSPVISQVILTSEKNVSPGVNDEPRTPQKLILKQKRSYAESSTAETSTGISDESANEAKAPRRNLFGRGGSRSR